MDINSASKKHGFTFKAVVSADQEKIIAEKSGDYIFAYGLRQSLTDSIAGAKSESEAAGLFAKRLEKLLAGTVSIREVGPRDPIMSEMKRLAEGRVSAAIAAKGMKKPENFKELVGKYIAKYESTLRDEAKANLAAVASVELDLDDLFDEEESEGETQE